MWFIVFTYMRMSEVRKFSHRTLRVILFKVKILWLVKFVMFVTWQKKPHTVRWCGYHYTHTHPFNGPLSRTIQVSQYQKGKPIWILLKQDRGSDSGISWAICKSAPRSRQTTMPAPHHSVFNRPDALPATPPTATKHWRQKYMQNALTRSFNLN